ncbi:MAG: AI-2E family transporter YdiK [Planctomycetes bacterium]|nr:AI-2E family transporter YdiK [Planctomycetota bacterium]
MTRKQHRDLFQILLSVLFLAGLVFLSLRVMGPFLPALVWASMTVIATWRLMLAVERRLWRKRWAAVIVMTIALLLVLIVPLSLAVGTIVTHVDEITGWVKSLQTGDLPAPPEWVARVPLVGQRVDGAWRQVLVEGDLAERVTPYLGDVVNWFIAQLGSLGSIVVHFLLTVVLAAILYAHGETAARAVNRFARRIGGEKGENAVTLAGQAIRGVALGVVVTAFAQAVLGGIGLAIVGVPFASLLTAIMFLLAIAQIGVAPVLVGCVAWLYWRGDGGWATGLLVWTVIVAALDNFLRPVLIRRGADLPLLLIFAGVIGGLVTFGLIGLFLGPVVLAVTYTLISAWIASGTSEESEAPA